MALFNTQSGAEKPREQANSDDIDEIREQAWRRDAIPARESEAPAENITAEHQSQELKRKLEELSNKGAATKEGPADEPTTESFVSELEKIPDRRDRLTSLATEEIGDDGDWEAAQQELIK